MHDGILKRTSTEAHVYMRRRQGAKIEYFDVSNMIYHKFSHGAVSYTLNEENVNVMLEFWILLFLSKMPLINQSLKQITLIFLLADGSILIIKLSI